MEVFGNVIKTNNLKLDDRQVMSSVREHINKKPTKDIYSGQKDKSVQDRPGVSVIEFHVNTKYRKYVWTEGMNVEYEVEF